MNKKDLSLHLLDRYGGEWTDEDLEKFFLFCLLNRATAYKKLCEIFDKLIERFWQGSIKRSFWPQDRKRVSEFLKESGYRFYRQATNYIFANNWVNAQYLRLWDREDMIRNCAGISYKLSSMFFRNTKKRQYAVIDVHIKRFLIECGYKKSNSYKCLEILFKTEALKRGKTVYELDMEIWQKRRRKIKQ